MNYNRLSETVIISYFAALAAFTLFFRRVIPGWGGLLAAEASAPATVAAVAFLRKHFPNARSWRVLRDWLPFPCVLLGYRMIHFLVNCERNGGFLPDRDGWLIAADRALFGLDPTVWLERIASPLLTEFLQIIYATNYFLPAVLVLVLYLSGRETAFRHSVWVLSLGYILSYLGYFVIPAVGPRICLSHSIPLEGILIREKLAALNYCLEAAPRDCFPSGHTELPLVTLWLASRHRRFLARIYLPVVLLLIFSTVYLRYHYVVDVLAGAALAGIVILAGKLTLPPPDSPADA